MGFLDIFIGAPQSKLAGIVVVLTMVIVGVIVLSTEDEISFGQKFVIMVLLFVVSAPMLLLSLFQLTCLVTGDGKGKTWWCGIYSWIIAVFTVIYCAMVVSVVMMAYVSNQSVMDQLVAMETFEEKKKAANDLASEILAGGTTAAKDLASKMGIMPAAASPEHFANAGETVMEGVNAMGSAINSGVAAVTDILPGGAAGAAGAAPKKPAVAAKPTAEGFIDYSLTGMVDAAAGVFLPPTAAKKEPATGAAAVKAFEAFTDLSANAAAF